MISTVHALLLNTAAIKVALASLIRDRVINPAMLKRNYNVSMHHARHMSQPFIAVAILAIEARVVFSFDLPLAFIKCERLFLFV